jgi:hypothetical protein
MPLPSRKFRIAFLLAVLLFVVADTWLTRIRTTDWTIPLWLVIYPVNADNSEVTARYIAQLTNSDFSSIEAFLSEEAQRYGLQLKKPVEVKLAPEVDEHPPAIPVGGSRLAIMWWSLKLRLWSKIHNNYEGPADLKLFVQYHDPETHERLGHSTGLQKGRVGIVNTFASRRYQEQNSVVITHELLHLFGATDKYDLATNLPYYPDGYAEPEKQPLYPQRWAELMGGRVPVSESEAEIPTSLRKTLIGEITAAEINWIAER